MNKKRKLSLYVLFAVIATATNLAVQRTILSFNNSNLNFIFALFLGTLVGLLIKYFLDKNWIFFDNTKGLKSQIRNFRAYTIMGIVTTIIYWVIETTFWLIWQKDNIRECGALLGLSIGYIIKYKLDKKFVFQRK